MVNDRKEFPERRVLLALGGNLSGRWGTPEETLAQALRRLEESGHMRLSRLSRLWRSAPFGGIPQPAFVNAVALLCTSLSPHATLKMLSAVEQAAGRRRGIPWGPRVLDLDIVDHDGAIFRPPGVGRRGSAQALHRLQRRGIVLPHPGISMRAFVLLPLAEIWPTWRHPVTGQTITALLAQLPARERASCRPLAPQPAAWAALRSQLHDHCDR